MKEHLVFLAFGSNLGNKEENINRAYNEIEKRIGNIVSKSAFYVTKPHGFESNNYFVNSVCELITKMNIETLFATTQTIEKEVGRTTKTQNKTYEDRLIDIDILLYDQSIVNDPKLTIPHPRFHLRNFVLQPFTEISPHTIHPILQKTIAQLRVENKNH